MAFYLTPNTQFKPFSYQEMLAPVLAYKEAYDAQEAALSEVELLSSDIGSKIAGEDPNSELRKTYNKYQEDLNKELQNFYSKGYNAETKKALTELKGRYYKELNPINDAYKAYIEDQKYLAKLNREHPEIIIEGLGASISDYMYGNTPKEVAANTNTIIDKATKAAASTSGRFTEILKPTGILGNQYYQFVTQQGISQDMVERLRSVIDNPSSKEASEYLKTEEGRALYNIVQEQRKINNYDSFSEHNKDKIDASILSGILSGVSYKESVDRVSNKGWEKPTDTTPPNTPTGTSGMYYREIPKVEYDGKTSTTKINEDLEFLSALKSNPSKLNDVWTQKGKTTLVGYGAGTPQYISEAVDISYLDRLQELSKEYNLEFNIKDENGNVSISGLDTAIKQLAEKISSSAISRQSYVLSMTDYDLASKVLTENITAFNTNNGNRDYSGLTTLNGSYIKNKNADDYLSGEKSIQYDPDKGIILTSTKDNNVKHSIIDPYILDGTGILAERIKHVQEAIKQKDYYLAKIPVPSKI